MGTNDLFTDEQIQSAIKGLATAALVEHAGLEDGVTDWWEAGGVFYDDLVTQGLITTP